MHMNGDFCLEFVWQNGEDIFFFQRLLVRPEVVEPLYDTMFQVLAHLSILHVAVLNNMQIIANSLSCCRRN